MWGALERPWREERVLWDADGLLVVDKPAGLAVHGGDEAAPAALVDRLAAWLAARGEPGDLAPCSLGVHQRLDKAASGVLLLVRDPALNAPIGQAMEAHRVERRYRAVVRGPLRGEGIFEDLLSPLSEGGVRVVERAGKPARAAYRVLRRVGERALLELLPETGRTHQLRVQLASRGSPICGDTRYGGEPAPRLMLHALELRSEVLPRAFGAPLPASFEQWLTRGQLSLPGASDLGPLLGDAVSLRWGLRAASEALRLVDGAADGLPGVVVESFGDHAVLTLTTREASLAREPLAEALCAAGARGVYLKLRLEPGAERKPTEAMAPSLPVLGEPAPADLVVREHGVPFRVRLGEGLHVGLFLDQRDNRALVRRLSEHARVLNLFAYTCSFSVMAAVGGASETVSVDLSRRALAWGRENFEVAGVPLAQHRFVAEEAGAWLGRALRRGERFDLVVLDPPSFASHGSKVFRVARDYEALAGQCLRVLNPGGSLLAVTNHRKTSLAGLRKLLRRAVSAAGRETTQMKTLGLPDDFPERPGGELPIKSVLVTVA